MDLRQHERQEAARSTGGISRERSYRPGTTPTSVGPRPLKSAVGPSYRYTSLQVQCSSHQLSILRCEVPPSQLLQTHLRINPVSTKFHNSPRAPPLLAAAATAPPVDGTVRVWKRSDWRRVLTTSKGAVTIEPHMPPRLQKVCLALYSCDTELGRVRTRLRRGGRWEEAGHGERSESEKSRD